MYTVARIIQPDFDRSWYEAVAVVQEVAAALGPLTTVPEPADLYLDDNGTLTLGFASESGEHPVTGLSRLLVALLDGVDAPAPIRELAKDNAGTAPRHTTVEGFSRALAFYERPDRANDLQALAGRLARLPREAESAEVELQRLRERLARTEEDEDSEQQADEKPGAWSAWRRPTPKQLAIGAGVALACVAALAVGQLARLGGVRTASMGIPAMQPAVNAQPEAEPAVAPSAQAPAPTAVLRGGESRSGTTPGSKVVSKPSKQTAAAAGSYPGQHRPQNGSGVPEAGVLAARRSDNTLPTTSGTVPTDRRPRDPLMLSTAGSVAAGARPERSPGAPDGTSAARAYGVPRQEVDFESLRIYSRADAEVQPARLMRPQLPQQPAPGADTGTFDILVDEGGDVEAVRLISPAHRYYDRMLVAAAKAWKFKPATLNGQPVKYRVRIPIILADPR